MSGKVVGVIMAGGRGERFWPASTLDRPKQFIDLTGHGTLIQQAVTRLAQIIPYRDIYIVTCQRHLSLARTQVPQVPSRNFIVEPEARDTAACVGLAAVWLERIYPNAVMLVIPADHVVPDVDRFCDAAEKALDFASSSHSLVTLGVYPDRPETGYGYIELGAPSGDRVFRAKRFVEKPDRVTAEKYVASGQFLWNSGMFAWSIPAIRAEIANCLPELHIELQVLAAAASQDALESILPTVFNRLPRISIDYGVLERSDNVFVVPSDFPWDDLGSWTAIARLKEPDKDGNVVSGIVLTEDSRNLVVTSQGRLVATLGVEDLIIVETDDAVLVCAKDRAQDIRLLASKAQKL